MALKASRVKTSTPETKQLEIFIQTLGVNIKPNLYRCDNLIYINVDIITPVLGVNITNFTKRSVQKIHYIVIKKQVYVNKYGLTKIIAESIEPVAFQLQDYIYEVIYKLETNGFVNKSDVVSREELCKALNDLSLSQTTEIIQTNTIESLNEEIKELSNDYSSLQTDNMNLMDEKNKLTEQNQELELEIMELKKMITTLSRYVKCNSKKVSIAAREIIDEYSPEDIDHLDEKDIETLRSQSVEIKNNRKKPIKNIVRRGKKERLIYDIIRSARPLFNNIYQWKCISDEENHIKKITIDGKQYRSLKHYSDEFLLEGNIVFNHDIIWNTLSLSDPEGIYLTNIIALLQRADENLISQIISIFTKN